MTKSVMIKIKEDVGLVKKGQIVMTSKASAEHLIKNNMAEYVNNN